MKKQEKESVQDKNSTDNADPREEIEEMEGIEETTEPKSKEEQQLADALKNMEDTIDQLQDKLFRQLAENENIRARSTRTLEETREYAIFNFAKDLITVMDNLSRTLQYLPSEPDDNDKNIAEGIKMTQKELSDVFKKHALESITPQSGDKFDYHYHHAISQIMTDAQEPGTIVHTMQDGYKIKDRLIRPAAVAVAKGSAPIKEKPDESDK